MITSPISNSQSVERADLIRKTAQDFGSIFVSMMLKAMRKNTGDNGFIPSSFGEKLYTEMLDDNYAGIISANSMNTFQDMVVKELERLDNIENSSTVKNLHAMQFSDQFAQYRMSKSDFESSLNEDTVTRINKWDAFVTEASELYNIDKNLVKAVIAKESTGNPFAVSRAGAKGLMQLMDTTASDMGVSNVFSPRDNIIGGVKYLFEMLQRCKGDEKLALAAYNAGPSAVEKYNGIPPYKETLAYVRDVLRYRDMLSKNSE